MQSWRPRQSSTLARTIQSLGTRCVVEDATHRRLFLKFSRIAPSLKSNRSKHCTIQSRLVGIATRTRCPSPCGSISQGCHWTSVLENIFTNECSRKQHGMDVSVMGTSLHTSHTIGMPENLVVFVKGICRLDHRFSSGRRQVVSSTSWCQRHGNTSKGSGSTSKDPATPLGLELEYVT